MKFYNLLVFVCVFLSRLLSLCLPIASVIIYVKLWACDLFNLFPLDYAGFLCEFNNLLVFVFLFLSRLLFLLTIVSVWNFGKFWVFDKIIRR